MSTLTNQSFKQFTAEWETKQLDQIADCLDNVRIPLNEVQRAGMPGPYPYCGANGVLDYVNDFVIDDDVILMAEDGGHFDEYAYRPIAYRMKGKIWVNNHAHILKAKVDCDQGFLYYSLVHKDILPYLSGGTRAKLNRFEMNKIEVNLPQEIDEQRAIAKALSDVDGLLSSLEALIAKKRAIRQATMQQLLTSKTRLPGFSGVWETKRFDELFKRLNGNSHKIQTSEYSVNGLHPVIDQGQDPVVGYSDQTEKLFKCPAGGVIVFGDHTRIVKFVDVDFLIGADGTQLLAMKGNSVAKFLYYQLSTKDIPNTGYNRHFKFLKDLTFKIPKMKEQCAITSVLSDIDAEIAALEQRRDKTRAIKQGMMQQLLTGRVRLSESRIIADDTDDAD